MWRAIYNYYKTSKGRVKIDGELSNEFEITEGVKQGGILSLYLFNYFINDLLKEIEEQRLGANIGDHDIGLISYCDDLIIISPFVSHANKMIKLCENFASEWKLDYLLHYKLNSVYPLGKVKIVNITEL